MASRFVLPFADVGKGITPSDGSKLFFFETGTSTPKDTYSDAAATTPNANPVIADANGVFPDIFIEGSYKAQLKDKNDAQHWEADPVASFSTSDQSTTIFSTVGSMVSSSVDSGSSVSSQGYTAAGDGGGASYLVKTAAQASSDGDFVDEKGNHTLANGNIAVIQDTAVINAKQFGATGDGVTDDIASLQAAVDFSVYRGADSEVFIPPGVYRTTTTLHLGYGDTFKSVVVRGSGYRYRAESGFNGTAIDADFSSSPAINIQGARGSVLKSLSLKGKNFDHVAALDLTINSATLGATWVDPAFVGNEDSRFAPYAAITVDAYSGTTPSPSYPSVTYPADLSQTQYSRNPSSDVLIEEVQIAGFIAGVVVQPCNFDSNGDFVKILNSSIERSKYGISVGNGQARNTQISSVQVSKIFNALTNKTHGKQIGQLQGTINDLTAGEVINVLDVNPAFSGPMHFENLYGEALWRIGDIFAGSANDNPIVFQSASLNFSLQADGTGVPDTVLGGNSQPVNISFNDCNFNNYRSVLVFLQKDNVVFNKCSLTPSLRDSTITSPYLRYAHNALSGGVVASRDCDTRTNEGIKFKQANVTTGTISAVVSTDQILSAPKATGVSFHMKTVRSLPYNQHEIVHPAFNVDKSTFVSSTLTDRTWTFEFAAGQSLDQLGYGGASPGDIVVDNNTLSVFFIRSLTTRTVICELQNNYKSDGGGGFDTINTFSETVGSVFFKNARLYSPAFNMHGDLTASSPTILNCLKGNETVSSDLAIGDYLLADANFDKIFDPSPKITNVVSSTITLDQNAIYTEARKALPIWISLPPANE